MQAIDKLKSDIDDWARRSGILSGAKADTKALDALRSTFGRAVGPVPQETLAAIFASFLSYFGADGPAGAARALDWLGGVGSLLLMDYDGTAFSRAEWEEIRDIMTLDSGEIDMEILSYILSQVMEHGGI